MKNLKMWSFVHALGILVYIGLVGYIMNNGDKWFGQMDNFIGPVTFLLLFTLSALVVGGLGIGKPIMLYIDGKKKEALAMLSWTVGWVFIFTIIAMLVAVKW
jgi:hypothetical protein